LASNFGTFVLYALSCVIAWWVTTGIRISIRAPLCFRSVVRAAGQPGLHVPSTWLARSMGFGTKMEPLLAWNRAGVGHLRRNLLHPIEQELGADDFDHAGSGDSMIAAGRKPALVSRKDENGMYRSQRVPLAAEPAELRARTTRRRGSSMLERRVRAALPTWERCASTMKTIWASRSPATPEQVRTQGWLFALADGVGRARIG